MTDGQAHGILVKLGNLKKVGNAMERLATAKYFAAGSVLLPSAAVLIWPSRMWLLAIFLLWVIGAAWYWIRAERKEQAERLTRTIESMQTLSVRTLNHHRHDWMNDLQVLFGYIRLQKQDKTIEYVEKIRERMSNESSIAKLGVPSLITFIQSFRTVTNSLELQVNIKGEVYLNECAVESDKIAETLIQTINAYRFSVKQDFGNPAVLRLELSADSEAVYASFYYQGEFVNEEQWKQKIKQQLQGAPLQPISFEQPFKTLLLKADMRA